jgi:hypothetical protein
MGSLVAVEGEIKPRADTHLENPALGGCDHALAIGDEILLPHREVDEAGQGAVVIEAHRSTLRSGDAQPILARAGNASSSQ